MTFSLIIKNKKRIFLSSLLFVVVFGAGLFTGQVLAMRKSVLGPDGTPSIEKVLDLYGASHSKEVSFNQFWSIWDKVKKNYVNQPVSDSDLFYGAIRGMVAGLDDPYTVYLPPKEAKMFASDLAGAFGGIGAEIGIKDKQLQVIAPLAGSPAEKAGLRPGDAILAIDGAETYGLSLEEAVSKIRGEKGTVVKLTLAHGGIGTAHDVSVTRDVINVPSVTWKMEDGGIAYLAINQISENTWKEFDAAVVQMTAKKPKGIILDMRSNPGGFLDTSVDIASEWIDKGVIVSEGANGTKGDVFETHGAHRLFGIPTVVLVDEGSASGAEIIAGALQDHHAATIMGKTSYGKGSVQDFEILPDGSALKVTVAKWFTPSGRAIDHVGITPDILVDPLFSPKDPNEKNPKPEDMVDRGVEKAREILLKK